MAKRLKIPQLEKYAPTNKFGRLYVAPIAENPYGLPNPFENETGEALYKNTYLNPNTGDIETRFIPRKKKKKEIHNNFDGYIKGVDYAAAAPVPQSHSFEDMIAASLDEPLWTQLREFAEKEGMSSQVALQYVINEFFNPIHIE